jgi:2-haloacid dehalogenase
VVRAVLFDVFGTLLDVHSVTQRADLLFPGHGARLSTLWRDKQIEYSRLRTMSGRYVPFSQVTRDALSYALDALGLAAEVAAQRQLLDEYARLEPFDDAEPALRRLRESGLRCGVLSNGDPPMLEASLNAAGLRGDLDPVLSADQVQAFKTAPQVYELGPRALNCAASEIVFVSSNGWDACGAAWYGYTTFWVNRGAMPLERLGVAPHASGASLRDAVLFAEQNQSNYGVEK